MELRSSDGAYSIGNDLQFSKTPMTNIKNRRVEKLWTFEDNKPLAESIVYTPLRTGPRNILGGVKVSKFQTLNLSWVFAN